MKFILGSANFGTAYGISNPSKKISKLEIQKILEFARKSKISQIDTAINYKNSEKLIGNFVKQKDFTIITKLPKIGKNITAPTIFGNTKKFNEFTPIISSASICSVTRIVPTSEAILEPTFPAKMSDIIVGENSKIVLDWVIYPTV